MKKSSYRVIKSIGIFLFLLLFGVFIYFFIKNQNGEHKQVAFSPEPNPKDFEMKPDDAVQRKRIGFEYQKSFEGNSETQLNKS